MICDSLDHLGIYNQFFVSNQIRHILTNLYTFVHQCVTRLLLHWDIFQSQLNDQGIFIWLLKQAVSQFTQNFHRASHNIKHLFFKNQFVFIGVHSWFFL